MRLVDRNHPQQMLLFFVAQDIHDGVRASVRTFVEELQRAREWVIHPPIFVDQGGDAETLGGYLHIYSALPPLELNVDVDAEHLEEVVFLIERVKGLSERDDLAIEFELDGIFVGAVEGGEADRSLTLGLIGEWRRVLNERRQK